ncbi:hypothetical protein COU59_01890 [Candidatus Pacearchaeota archaeon CG10_big_fil_rev_8_21_14_0_10_34_12]|nr:MAG: hypothetical protein COU59_01890 [Candidatus Pacearchaeota archaeon CG10_big_fil_rev_8_21_14_0_10_34_12]
MEKKKDELWIFLHIPRTGGNTISEALIKKFPGQVLLTSHIRYQKNPYKINKSNIRFILGHATYFGIHKSYPDKIPRYFTFIRDPAERIVSQYNQRMQELKKRISFDEWHKNQVKNEMVHFLDLKFKGAESSNVNTPRFFMPFVKKMNYKAVYTAHSLIFKLLRLHKKNNFQKLANARKVLDSCYFIGLTGRNEDYYNVLNLMSVKGKKLKIQGKSKKVLKLDEELREKIHEEHPLDLELYNYAKTLRKLKLDLLKIKND